MDMNSEAIETAQELNIEIPAIITPEFCAMVFREARRRINDLQVRNS